MANTTVYPYGTGGSLPSSIGIINDLVTGGVDKALSAEQGKVLNQRFTQTLFVSDSATPWLTGNPRNNNTIDTAYQNKYYKIDVSSIVGNVDSVHLVRSTPPDSTYKLGVFLSVDGNTCTSYYDFGTNGGSLDITITGKNYIVVNLWDKPSTERAQQEVVTVTYIGGINQQQPTTVRTYSNPVILSENKADPCIVDGLDGYFYVFSTGTLGTTTMWRSPNLTDWEAADSPFTAKAVSDCKADLGTNNDVLIWAPEIVKIGDKYNMYISRQNNPMVVFQSDHPNFGYEYIGQIISTTNGLTNDNIDACVRYDIDGTLWIFWGSTYGIYRQKLTTTGLALDTNDTKAHVAGRLISEDSSRETVFEGAYLYRKQGYWYLFVTSGFWSNSTYRIKVGRCASLSGTFVDKDGNNMTDGYATTILSSASGDTLYGPGHNGQIITDRDNRTYMLFHSLYVSAGSNQRKLCLQEIFWDMNGWPYFENSGKPQAANNVKPVL